jgi:hypothetical protein
VKLSQLQEARYAGQHPVITRLEQIADRVKADKNRDNYWKVVECIPIEDTQSVTSILDNKYQRLDQEGDEYPAWKISRLPDAPHVSHGILDHPHLKATLQLSPKKELRSYTTPGVTCRDDTPLLVIYTNP